LGSPRLCLRFLLFFFITFSFLEVSRLCLSLPFHALDFRQTEEGSLIFFSGVPLCFSLVVPEVKLPMLLDPCVRPGGDVGVPPRPLQRSAPSSRSTLTGVDRLEFWVWVDAPEPSIKSFESPGSGSPLVMVASVSELLSPLLKSFLVLFLRWTRAWIFFPIVLRPPPLKR